MSEANVMYLPGGVQMRAEHGTVPVVLDIVHYWVHQGEMFHGEYGNAALGNGNNVDLVVTCGAEMAHTTFDVTAGGQVTLYLYEGPTLSADGTDVPMHNMKRSAVPSSPGSVVRHTPTVSATGVALVNGRILPGGTSPTTRVGSNVRNGTEWILKPNTIYLLRANNSSGGAIACNVAVEFYEHDED